MIVLIIAIYLLDFCFPIEYWQGIFQTEYPSKDNSFEKPNEIQDHTNYRWWSSNPSVSLLDRIYVDLPFSKVSVSTGANPITIPGAKDPYLQIFVDRMYINKDYPENKTSDSLIPGIPDIPNPLDKLGMSDSKIGANIG